MTKLLNERLRDETAATVAGVEGRHSALIVWPHGQTFMHQTFKTSRTRKDGSRILVDIRFDDNCRNGANSFSITGTTYTARGREDTGGCIHDEIAASFPEFEHLIKWHLCDTRGPMHYLANVVYLAGNRDHYGRAAGEVSSTETAIQFGSNPIKHVVKSKFWNWLKSAAAHPAKDRFDFEVIQISEKRETSGKPEYYHGYTFGGFDAKWYECPFKSEAAALDFLAALQHCEPQFVVIPTGWSEGKARELEAARRVAIWPDATDEQLSVSKEELTAVLEARRAPLLEAMRHDLAAAGFFWSVEDACKTLSI